MTKEESEKQYKRMAQEPVSRLVTALAVPSVLSMLVSSIYNMADAAFVGTINTSASGAIGVVFGYMAILQAVGFLCGQGAGSIMSRYLGQHNEKDAGRYASTGLALSFSLGALIALVSLIVFDPMIRLLGSTPTIAPYARIYIGYIMVSAPVFTTSLSMNTVLRYAGKAKLGTIGMMAGSVINIFGDYLLIVRFDMGIAGAGLSTAVSQLISFVILLCMFLGGRTQVRLSFSNVCLRGGLIGGIITTGLPSLIRQSLNGLATIILNTCAARYGDAAVAAMSIVSRISFFVVSVAIGVGQGFQPVSGFNYGAGNYERVKKAFRFTLTAAEVVVAVFSVFIVIFAVPLVTRFRDDPEVIRYALRALYLQTAANIFMPLCMTLEMGFQSTGQRLYASFLSSLRSGLMFIPLLLVLEHFRGIAGVQEAQPAALVLSFFISLFFLREYNQLMDHKAKEVSV